MKRDCIHVTMTAQLRRDQVRQRLEALADNTGLPVAQIAGRALSIGLGQLESNPLLIFPGTAAPTVTSASAADSIAPPPPETVDKAVLVTTSPLADTRRTPPAPMPEQPAAPAEASQADPTPRAARPDRISSRDAARAMDKTMTAFSGHLHRHPKLKRHSKRVGRLDMWDLAGLRAEWAK